MSMMMLRGKRAFGNNLYLLLHVDYSHVFNHSYAYSLYYFFLNIKEPCFHLQTAIDQSQYYQHTQAFMLFGIRCNVSCQKV